MDKEELGKKLAKPDKIRFLVVDEDKDARSSAWFVTCESGSLYLAPKALGSAMKLSLHPKGRSNDGHDCQFGLASHSMKRHRELGFCPPSVMRWTRAEPPAVGALHVVSILFPSDYLTDKLGKPQVDGKLKFAFPLPPPGHVIELGIFTHLQHPDQLEDALIRTGGTPISYHDLANGEFASLVARQTVIEPWKPFFTKPDHVTSRALSGEPAPGETIKGRALLIGDVPKDGSAFVLAEAGPITVTG